MATMRGTIAWKWYKKHRFINRVALAILAALAYPRLGLMLRPDITAGWVAVIFIFTMSGLSLKTREIMNASKRVDFHVAVQLL